MTVSAQGWVRTPVLLLASILDMGKAHSAEAIAVPAEAKAAPQAAAVRIIEQVPRATIRERHLRPTAEISLSDRFDQISEWFEKLNDKQLEELQSRHSHESLREALIRCGFPALVTREVTEAFSQFFKEPQSQVIVKQLQQLPANDLKHLQDLAKRYLETNSPDAQRDLVKAFERAGIRVEPFIMHPFLLILCLIGVVTIGGVGLPAILNSTHLSIIVKKKPTHTKLPVVGTGDEKDPRSKTTRDDKPKDRAESKRRVAPEPKAPPGPSLQEIAEMVNQFEREKKRNAG